MPQATPQDDKTATELKSEAVFHELLPLIRKADTQALEKLGVFRGEFNKHKAKFEVTTDNIRIKKGYIRSFPNLVLLVSMILSILSLANHDHKKDEAPAPVFFLLAGFILMKLLEKIIHSRYMSDFVFTQQPLENFIVPEKKWEFKRNARKYLTTRVELFEYGNDFKLSRELQPFPTLSFDQCQLLVDCYHSLNENDPILLPATKMIETSLFATANQDQVISTAIKTIMRVNDSSSSNINKTLLNHDDQHKALVKNFDKTRIQFDVYGPIPELLDHEVAIEPPVLKGKVRDSIDREQVIVAFNQVSYDLALKISAIFQEIYEKVYPTLPLVLHKIIIGYYDNYTHLLEKFKPVIEKGMCDIEPRQAAIIRGIYPCLFMVPYRAGGLTKNDFARDFPDWKLGRTNFDANCRFMSFDEEKRIHYRFIIMPDDNFRLLTDNRIRVEKIYPVDGVKVIDSTDSVLTHLPYKHNGYRKTHCINNYTYHVVDIPLGKVAKIKVAGLTYELHPHPPRYQPRVFKIKSDSNLQFEFEKICTRPRKGC